MQILTTENETAMQSEISISGQWERALKAGTKAEREAAGWRVFNAASGASLPDVPALSVPAEVRPILIVAKERSMGRSVLAPLESLRWNSDPAVQDATARALVRLSIIEGDWDPRKVHELLAPLRTGRTRPAVEAALDDFSADDARAMLRRVLGERVEDSVWVWPVGFGLLFSIAVTLALAGYHFRHPFTIAAISPLAALLIRFLRKPGSHFGEWHRNRMLTLLARIEERIEEDADAIREALPKLRVLSWRISNESDEVREAAARLVRRIQESDRNVGQLPIAAAPALPTAEVLLIPAGPGDPESK